MLHLGVLVGFELETFRLEINHSIDRSSQTNDTSFFFSIQREPELMVVIAFEKFIF